MYRYNHHILWIDIILGHIMKYSTILSLVLAVASVDAFAPTFVGTTSRASSLYAANPDPVDKSMKGIDAEGSFDPTAGSVPALQRNNNGEVWVEQVSSSC
jgi:hypothetical protein